MSCWLVVGLVVLALLAVASVIAVVAGAVRQQRARELTAQRHLATSDAEQKLRDMTRSTLRAMNEVIRQQYRQ